LIIRVLIAVDAADRSMVTSITLDLNEQRTRHSSFLHLGVCNEQQEQPLAVVRQLKHDMISALT